MTPPVLKNYVNGEWTKSSSGETFDVTNPANGELIARSQSSTVDDIKRAIDLASECQETEAWASQPRVRALGLYKWAELILQEREDLARLLTMENGKILRQSRSEIENSADHLMYYAGLARNIYGRSFALSDSSYSIIAREPMGVVGHIVPWNYPVLLLFRALAASLAAGNVCIIKPASYTPVTTARIIELAENVKEIPPGVLTYVTGPGPVVGAEIARNSKVNMVALTGDTRTGKEILRLTAVNVKKTSLELGGKSPNIVLSDADIERAMEASLSGAFTASGQVCFAGSRLVVERNMHDQFVRTFKQRAESMRVGNGLNEDNELGPIISHKQMENVLTYIETGKQEATLLTGGSRLVDGELSRGNFIAPTVFDNVPSDARIAQEEIFGPVVSIIPFEDEEDAARIANETEYGLAAAVWTKDVKKAFRLARKIKAGTVWVNAYGKTFAETEYGGYKQSGIGRERGIEGLLEFTQLKHIYFELS
jgi:betaine-aldehyde dehydrogenase